LEYFTSKFLIKCITLRLSNVYGFNQDEDKLIPSIVRSLLLGKDIKINKPNQKLNFIYIDDVVDAICKTIKYINLSKENNNYEKIDIGSKKFITTTFVAKYIKSNYYNLSKSSIILNREQSKSFEYKLDLDNAEKLLGWKYFTTFEDGIKKIITEYKFANKIKNE